MLLPADGTNVPSLGIVSQISKVALGECRPRAASVAKKGYITTPGMPLRGNSSSMATLSIVLSR